MQQHLVNIVVALALRKISRKSDSLVRMVALTKARLRVVESKRPTLTV
jgi:hypothetical protein